MQAFLPSWTSLHCRVLNALQRCFADVLPMTKGSFAEMNCPIAQTLERVGEWWTLLILRNAFCGMSRFDDFQRHLGIGSNILAQRLKRLTEEGILTRTGAEDDKRAFEYRLTEKGRALYPILVAMTEWGEQWVPNPMGQRIRFVEQKTGQSIAGLRLQSTQGVSLAVQEISIVPGPGADDKMRELSSFAQRKITETNTL
jgi:DNA-binding HxlR family transcriptional regulator